MSTLEPLKVCPYYGINLRTGLPLMIIGDTCNFPDSVVSSDYSAMTIHVYYREIALTKLSLSMDKYQSSFTFTSFILSIHIHLKYTIREAAFISFDLIHVLPAINPFTSGILYFFRTPVRDYFQ